MARKSSASRRTKRKPASKTKPAKFVYYFGEGKADGNGKMKPLLGGKGANLAEMTRIGLPVPPGFTISTEVCTYFYAHNRSYPRAMQAEVEEGFAGWNELWARLSVIPKRCHCWWRSDPGRAIPCRE
jgi:pyruvate,orthophosphate dikinase